MGPVSKNFSGGRALEGRFVMTIGRNALAVALSSAEEIVMQLHLEAEGSK